MNPETITLSGDHPSAMFQYTPPEDADKIGLRLHITPKDLPAGAVARLLHLRLKGNGKPRDTELFEFKVRGDAGRHDTLVLELDGAPKRKTPVAKRDMPGTEHELLIEYDLKAGLVTANVGGEPIGGTSHLTVGAGETLELIFGFGGPGEMVPPIGWVVVFPDQWATVITGHNTQGAVWAPAVPDTPPAVKPPAVPPGTTPPVAPGPVGDDPAAELRADLEKLIEKYAAAKGVNPLVVTTLQLLLSQVGG